MPNVSEIFTFPINPRVEHHQDANESRRGIERVISLNETCFINFNYNSDEVTVCGTEREIIRSFFIFPTENNLTLVIAPMHQHYSAFYYHFPSAWGNCKSLHFAINFINLSIFCSLSHSPLDIWEFRDPIKFCNLMINDYFYFYFENSFTARSS